MSARSIPIGARRRCSAALRNLLCVSANQRKMASDGVIDTLVELALTYIHFAEAHPALYALMFGQELSTVDEVRVACAAVFARIQEVAVATHPQRDPHGLATAGWALAHGLAPLHIDGTLGANDDVDFDTRVRAAFAALLTD